MLLRHWDKVMSGEGSLFDVSRTLTKRFLSGPSEMLEIQDLAFTKLGLKPL